MAILKFPVTQEDYVQGDFNAPITLVEYGDYECPYCGAAYPIVKRIQKHFAKRLRFVFRNFPIVDSHPDAMNAAMSAEFAASKNQFWQMHDMLYENQEALAISDLLGYADALNLSSTELQKVLEDKTYEKKIEKDFLSGVRSGVNGTPGFFINGNFHNGSFEYDELLDAINEAAG